MKSVCGLGDSIMKGVVLDEGQKYRVSERCFASLCKDELGIEVENAGRFGSTVRAGERSLERCGSLENFDYVLLEFGGNDCDFNWKAIAQDPEAEHQPNCSIADFRAIYTLLVHQIRQTGVRPVMLSLVPIDSERYFATLSKGLNADNILRWLAGNVRYITDWHERYNLEVFKLARELDVPMIDITSPFLEERSLGSLLCDDGIHPNVTGHKLIAEAIRRYIESRYETVERWLEAAV